MRLFRRGRRRAAAPDEHLALAREQAGRRRATDVLADVTPDQALAQTYAMLYAASPALNSGTGYGYAREALPGLLEVLAFDSPDSFRLLTDGEVSRLAASPRCARPAGPTCVRCRSSRPSGSPRPAGSSSRC